MWSSRLGGDKAAPGWKVVYKPLTTKRTADLQWGILHSAIACYAIVCVFNPSVLNTCPFYSHPKTVFRCFSEPEILRGFHTLLAHVFNLYDVTFTEKVLILSAG